MKQKTMTIQGKEYNIIGYEEIKKDNVVVTNIPLLDIKLMSDEDWQLGCLKSRLEHPEYYSSFEDVNERIEYLKNWLSERNIKF